MSTPLEIVVTGDTSGAAHSLAELRAQLGQTAIAAQKTDSSLDQVSKTLSNVASTGGSAFSKLGSTVTGALSSVTNSAEPFSRSLHQSFHAVFEDATGASRGIASVASELLGVLGPLGLVAGVLFIPKIVEFAESLFKASEAAKLAKANLQNLNDVMADANKQAGEQISSLKILYETATSTNVAYKDRLAAVKELQKEFPDYFKNISQETILNGGAKDSYDKLTISIINNARAKAVKDKLDQLEAQRLDVQYQKQKIINATTAEYNRLQEAGLQKTGINQGSSAKLRQQGLDVIKNRREEALKLQDINEKSLNDQEKFLKDFAGLGSLASAVEDQNKTKDPKAKKTNPFADELKALEDYYKQVQAKRVQEYDANITDAGKNATAVAQILLGDELNFLEKKKQLLEKYGKAEGDNNLKIAETNKKISDSEIKFIDSQRIKSTLPKIPSLNKEETQKITAKVTVPLSDDILKKLIAIDNLNDKMAQMGQILQKTLLPAFDALFTTLVEGGKRAGQSLSQVFNNLIKQLALTFAKAVALAAIISVFGGPTFGAALDKGLGLTSVFTPHATGGTNLPGGLSLVGEHGPELMSIPRGANIIPNGQLNAISGGQVFIPNLTVRGSDLVVAFNRATATTRRNG